MVSDGVSDPAILTRARRVSVRHWRRDWKVSLCQSQVLNQSFLRNITRWY